MPKTNACHSTNGTDPSRPVKSHSICLTKPQVPCYEYDRFPIAGFFYFAHQYTMHFFTGYTRVACLLVTFLPLASPYGLSWQPPQPQAIPSPGFRWWTPEDPIPLMPIDRFWSIIEESHLKAESRETWRASLQTQLEALNDVELNQFQLRYCKLINDAGSMRLWNAIYLINDGCGDSSFAYFLDDLVMQGKPIYEATIQDPESLLDRPLTKHGVPIHEIHYADAPGEIYAARHVQPDSPNKKFFPVFWKYQKPTDRAIDEKDSDIVRKTYPRIWDYRNRPKP